jgi:hypothetical protein
VEENTNGETLIDCFRDAENVMRVDEESGSERVGGAEEFGENQRRLVGVLLTEDVLHRGS